jgi:hypothetical protein
LTVRGLMNRRVPISGFDTGANVGADYIRFLEPECGRDANDELAHRPGGQQRIAALGLTEPRHVDGHLALGETIDNPSMVRNCISIGVFDQTLNAWLSGAWARPRSATASRRVSSARAALASAMGQSLGQHDRWRRRPLGTSRLGAGAAGPGVPLPGLSLLQLP